jgi:hypothetical protein
MGDLLAESLGLDAPADAGVLAMVVGLKHDNGACGGRPKPGVGRSPKHHIACRKSEPDRPDYGQGPDGKADPAHPRPGQLVEAL